MRHLYEKLDVHEVRCPGTDSSGEQESPEPGDGG
jgi:hypothetical protein